MRLLYKLFFGIFGLLSSIVGILLLNFLIILLFGSFFIEDDTKDFDGYQHVLIPGAGNSPLGDWQNPTFVHRMQSGIQLDHELKIQRIVCSGKKIPPLYDEANDMRIYLIQHGIDSNRIVVDESSNNTIESLRNYALRYPNDSVIIISQHLHLQRAIVIAHLYGLHALGYSAGAFREEAKWKLLIRELFARAKMWWELF